MLLIYHKNRRRRIAPGSQRFPHLGIRRALCIVLKCYVLLVVMGQPYDHLKCTSAPIVSWRPFTHTPGLLRITDFIVASGSSYGFVREGKVGSNRTGAEGTASRNSLPEYDSRSSVSAIHRDLSESRHKSGCAGFVMIVAV